MISIANTSYSASNLYNNPYEKLTEASTSSSGAKSGTEVKPSASSGDTVTLSSEVAIARTRESMGLNPTGPITLGDFKTVAENQTQTINTKLASFMKDLSIPKDQKITLSLDSKSNITIKENFSGKSKLEKALNEDKGFSLAFKGLSANSGVLNYTKGLQTKISNTSLADFMDSDSDSDWSDILSLASKYSDLKSSGNPLATLVGISQSQTPYEFTYNPDSKTA